jgi:hypothetical protein
MELYNLFREERNDNFYDKLGELLKNDNNRKKYLLPYNINDVRAFAIIMKYDDMITDGLMKDFFNLERTEEFYVILERILQNENNRKKIRLPYNKKDARIFALISKYNDMITEELMEKFFNLEKTQEFYDILVGILQNEKNRKKIRFPSYINDDKTLLLILKYDDMITEKILEKFLYLERNKEFYNILKRILKNENTRKLYRKVIDNNRMFKDKSEQTLLLLIKYDDMITEEIIDDFFRIQKTEKFYSTLEKILQNENTRLKFMLSYRFNLFLLSSRIDKRTLLLLFKYDDILENILQKDNSTTREHIRKILNLEKTKEFYDLLDKLLSNKYKKYMNKITNGIIKYEKIEELIIDPKIFNMFKKKLMEPNTTLVGDILYYFLFNSEFESFDKIMESKDYNINNIIINEQDYIIKAIISYLPENYFSKLKLPTNCNYSNEILFNVNPKLYFLSAHGGFTESYFLLPDNVSILFQASNLNFGFGSFGKFLNETNISLRILFERYIKLCAGRVYHSGMICPDVSLYFGDVNKIMGIYNENDSNMELLDLPEKVKISEDILYLDINETKRYNILSNIINTISKNDPNNHYFIMLTSCRVNQSSHHLSRLPYDEICDRIKLIKTCKNETFCKKKEIHYDNDVLMRNITFDTFIDNELDNTDCTINHLLKFANENLTILLYQERCREIIERWNEKKIILHYDYILLLDELYIYENKIEIFYFLENMEYLKNKPINTKTFLFQLYYNTIREQNVVLYNNKKELLLYYINKYPEKTIDLEDMFHKNTFVGHIVSKFVDYNNILSDKEKEIMEILFKIFLNNGKYNHTCVFGFNDKYTDMINDMKTYNTPENSSNIHRYIFDISKIEDFVNREKNIGLKYNEFIYNKKFITLKDYIIKNYKMFSGYILADSYFIKNIEKEQKGGENISKYKYFKYIQKISKKYK